MFFFETSQNDKKASLIGSEICEILWFMYVCRNRRVLQFCFILFHIFQDFAQPHWLWFPQYTASFLPFGQASFPWRRAMPIRATDCAATASVSFFGGEKTVSPCRFESWLVSFWIWVFVGSPSMSRSRRRWKTCKDVMHCACPQRFCKGPRMKVAKDGVSWGHDHQMSSYSIVQRSSRPTVAGCSRAAWNQRMRGTSRYWQWMTMI